MTHVRGQIREWLRQQLNGIDGLQGFVVIDAQEIPEDLELPWAHVAVGDEDIQAITLGGRDGRKLSREAQVTVDLFHRDESEPLIRAEGYCAAIEARLGADPRMGGLVKNSELRAYTVTHSDEGSQPIVRVRMQWLVTYWTYERDATVPV